jgi:hypothetical protein
LIHLATVKLQWKLHQLPSLATQASTLLSSPLNPSFEKAQSEIKPRSKIRFISTAIPLTPPLQLHETQGNNRYFIHFIAPKKTPAN